MRYCAGNPPAADEPWHAVRRLQPRNLYPLVIALARSG